MFHVIGFYLLFQYMGGWHVWYKRCILWDGKLNYYNIVSTTPDFLGSLTQLIFDNWPFRDLIGKAILRRPLQEEKRLERESSFYPRYGWTLGVSEFVPWFLQYHDLQHRGKKGYSQVRTPVVWYSQRSCIPNSRTSATWLTPQPCHVGDTNQMAQVLGRFVIPNLKPFSQRFHPQLLLSFYVNGPRLDQTHNSRVGITLLNTNVACRILLIVYHRCLEDVHGRTWVTWRNHSRCSHKPTYIVTLYHST